MASPSTSDPAPQFTDFENGKVDVVFPNSDSVSSPVTNFAPDDNSDEDDKKHAIGNNTRNPTTPQPSYSSPNSRARAPSPPRWRFVNEAKKSLGYSSNAAGQVVIGKSAQELGAEYTPPTITKSEKNEEREIGKLVVKEWDVAEEKIDEEG